MASGKALWCFAYPNHDHIPPLHRSKPTWGHLWLSRSPRRCKYRFSKKRDHLAAVPCFIRARDHGLCAHHTSHHIYYACQWSYRHIPYPNYDTRCLPRARPTPRPGHDHLCARRSTAQIALPAAASGRDARAPTRTCSAGPRAVRCRRVQHQQPTKTCGPSCGRCALCASKERHVRKRRRAMAAPAAACDGGLQWRASDFSM